MIGKDLQGVSAVISDSMAIAPTEALRRKSVPTLGFCICKRQLKLCVRVKENTRTLCVAKKFSQTKITFLKN